MSTNKTDVVGEYLREVELRLSGLPLLQRRELLADLETHIETARSEGVRSEGELIEILERLGSPEVVAAAAYEEAGSLRVSAPPPQPRHWIRWVVIAAVAVGVLFFVGLVFLFMFAGVDSGPLPESAVPPPFPTATG